MSVPRKYPPAFRPVDWNAMCDCVNGFTPSGTFRSGYKYLIDYDGTDYYANNAFQCIYGGSSDNGGVDGGDPVAVIQAALDNLTAARTWQEKVVIKGTYDLDQIDVPSYTFLDLTQAKITATDYVFYVAEDQGGGVWADPQHHITFLGGYFDGDGIACDAILGGGGVHDIKVLNGHFENFGTGAQQAIWLRGYGLTIAHNTFRDINGVPMNLGKDEGEEFSVTNVKALFNSIYNEDRDVEDAIEFDQVTEGLIQGNFISYHGDINLYGACQNVQVVNNQVIGTKYGVSCNIDANDDLPSDCLIAKNNLVGYGAANSWGVSTGGSDPHQTTRIDIFDNYINNYTTGVYLYWSDVCRVQRNKIISCTTPVDFTGSTNYEIKNNYGYVTENRGTSTGTGAEQTIAHGLAGDLVPNHYTVVPTETGTTVSSLWADAANIYVTVTNNKPYGWSVSVI